MIAGIKRAFITNLPHVEWMDEETRGNALKKVQVDLSLSSYTIRRI